MVKLRSTTSLEMLSNTVLYRAKKRVQGLNRVSLCPGQQCVTEYHKVNKVDTRSSCELLYNA
jgi:hypothetical protein